MRLHSTRCLGHGSFTKRLIRFSLDMTYRRYWANNVSDKFLSNLLRHLNNTVTDNDYNYYKHFINNIIMLF